MDQQKNRRDDESSAIAGLQSLEKKPPFVSNDWKASKYSAWLAAFAAAFCASAFIIVARCLLRQGAEAFPVPMAAGVFAAGALAGIMLLRLRRYWTPALAVWLVTAGTFASAWAFKFLAPGQIQLAVLPFAFFSGALIASLAIRRIETLVFALAGALVAQPVVALAIPKAGYTANLYALAVAMAVVFLIVSALSRVRVFALLAGVGFLAAAAFTAPVNLSRVTALEGWQFHSRKEGLGGAVTLIEKQAKPGQPLLQRLILDNRYIIAGQLGFGEKRLGHVPLLLRPGARTVLFLNANAGVAVAAAKSYGALERIDCVEPLPEIAAFLPQFAIANDEILREPRAKIIATDIRKYLAATNAGYDVIVANPMPPSHERSAELFTAEFYRDIGARLAPGGVFMQWLPLFQIDAGNFKTIIRTFAAEFSDAQGFIGIYNGELPVFGLFHRAAGGAGMPGIADIQKQLRPSDPAHAFVSDPRDLLGSRLFDHASLISFAGEGALSSDAAQAPVFPAEMKLNPQDIMRGGAILAAMLAAVPTNASLDSLVTSTDGDEDFRRQVSKRTETLRHYLTGDIFRATGDESKNREMVEAYLRALDSEPDLLLVRAMLFAQTIQRPKTALPIYRGLLKHNPDDKQLKDLICTVQEVRAREAGVPLPPSACGPGTMPPMPAFPAAPVARKPAGTNGLSSPLQGMPRK